jgi:hypothetical protein
MINPSDFIKVTPKQEIAGAKVGGTFVCQDCLESISDAVLDEDKMILVYTCSLGHANEAKI